MTISEISINRPVFAWMLMAGLIIFGFISFHRMGISQLPDVDFPVVNVQLEYDNASPELMETNVVDVIEDAIMGIEGLTSVTSSTSETYANVTCEFVLDHNVSVAMQEVQNRIQQIQNLLPTALYPPVITKTNPVDQPILWVMLTADQNVPLYQLMMYARNTLKDQLTTIPNVGNVTLAGYVDPNLRVWIDMNKLYKYELLSTDVLSAIQTEQIEQPAGRIEARFNELNIRVLGEENTPQKFGDIRINTRAGSPNFKPIRLDQVSRVEEGISDLIEISRYDGKTAVGLGIVKQHGANAVEVSRLVHQKIAEIQKDLPPGYHAAIQMDTTQFVRDSVNELNFTLILSAVLTSIVCFLFLGTWSSTLNVFLAIPTSIVGAFIALYFFGFTLNTFTLLGLSLAIGIVVDDAIMMMENITRHYEMGKSRVDASIDGSKEITFAAIAATLAIAAIFVPVIFMQGVVGRYFYQYGVTVTVAVFLSLLEALTLTPMRCSRFLQLKKENPSRLMRFMDGLMEDLSRWYKKSLVYVLKHRYLVLAASVGLFAVSLIFFALLREELIPDQDQSLFLLTLKTPVSSSIEATDSVYQRAEDYLRHQPEVQDIYTTIGNYENNNVVNAGIIYVSLKDFKHRRGSAHSQRAVMDRTKNDLLKMLPNVDVFTQDLSLTGFSTSRGFPIEFTLEGSDWMRLRDDAKTVIAKIGQSGFVSDINTDYEDGMPEAHLTPDRDKAADDGVSVASIGQEVGVLMGGEKFTSNTEFPIGGHRYYIRVRSEQDQHDSLDDLEKIQLRSDLSAPGELIQMPKVAYMNVIGAPQLIFRSNRQRAIRVYANVLPDKSQETALEKVEAIGKGTLGPGSHLTMGGSAKAFRDSFKSLIFALILGVAVSYMVLASQFNSFIHPISVLAALPFSFTGAFAALWATGQSLSLFSMIGLILLMGIVKKNSILLVDFTNHHRRQGVDPEQALMEACPIRLRPILMTSIATVAGAVPAALNFGPGAETRVPMAISIIGGVTVSTLLTLFAVPSLYIILTRFEHVEKPREVTAHPAQATV